MPSGFLTVLNAEQGGGILADRRDEAFAVAGFSITLFHQAAHPHARPSRAAVALRRMPRAARACPGEGAATSLFMRERPRTPCPAAGVHRHCNLSEVGRRHFGEGAGQKTHEVPIQGYEPYALRLLGIGKSA